LIKQEYKKSDTYDFIKDINFLFKSDKLRVILI
jgi:hypothetical protein